MRKSENSNAKVIRRLATAVQLNTHLASTRNFKALHCCNFQCIAAITIVYRMTSRSTRVPVAKTMSTNFYASSRERSLSWRHTGSKTDADFQPRVPLALETTTLCIRTHWFIMTSSGEVGSTQKFRADVTWLDDVTRWRHRHSVRLMSGGEWTCQVASFVFARCRSTSTTATHSTEMLF